MLGSAAARSGQAARPASCTASTSRRALGEVARAPGSCSASPSTDAAGSRSAAATGSASRLPRATCACCATAHPSRTTRRSGPTGRSTSPLVGWARRRRPRLPPRADGDLDCSPTARNFPNGCAVTRRRPLALDRGELRAEGEPDRPQRARSRSSAVWRGTVPDGVAFTKTAASLVSCYRPDRIVHIDPTGTPRRLPRTRRGPCSRRRRTSSSPAAATAWSRRTSDAGT